MPSVPKQTKCAMLGCKNERSKKNSYCLDHGGVDAYQVRQTDKRREFNSMYDQSMWKSLRRAQLSKQPICVSCLTHKHIKAATVVDHLFAWSHIGKEAFYNNVFQSLCAECHADKTKLEQRGIYRRYHDHTHTDHTLNQYKSFTQSVQTEQNETIRHRDDDRAET